ncbi:MAG TPA: hypothetical protein VGH09_12445 [Solirubrobacteraceae bacterium]|jgi:hypothetical protein
MSALWLVPALTAIGIVLVAKPRKSQPDIVWEPNLQPPVDHSQRVLEQIAVADAQLQEERERKRERQARRFADLQEKLS